VLTGIAQPFPLFDFLYSKEEQGVGSYSFFVKLFLGERAG